MRLKHTFLGVLSVIGSSASAFAISRNSSDTIAEQYVRSISTPLSKLGADICLSIGLCGNVVCVIGFTISTTYFYYLHEHDNYQDQALLCGIVSGLCMGLGLQNDLQEILLLILPWTVLLSLVISSLAHSFVRYKNRMRCKENSCDRCGIGSWELKH